VFFARKTALHTSFQFNLSTVFQPLLQSHYEETRSITSLPNSACAIVNGRGIASHYANGGYKWQYSWPDEFCAGID
jgi:hypothetical protein